MLHKSFKNGTSSSGRSCSNAMSYFLGSDRNREGAKIIKGFEEDTLAICKYIEEEKHYKNLYQSGCLSFEEQDINDMQKHEIMESFESCLFPNMDKGSYNIIWIEHKDKDRLELNYVIPMIDLETKKTLEVYQHSRDAERIKSWQEMKNYEYNLTSPDDPEKQKLFELPKNLSKEREIAIKQISRNLERKFLNNEIQSREDVLNELKANYDISRVTKNSISIKTETHGTLRLKGEIFKENINKELFNKENKDAMIESYDEASKKAAYEKHKEAYSRLLEARERRLEQRKHITPKQGQKEQDKAIEAQEIDGKEQKRNIKKLTSQDWQELKAHFAKIREDRASFLSQQKALKTQEFNDKKREQYISKLKDQLASRKQRLETKNNAIHQISLEIKARQSRFFGLGALFMSKAETKHRLECVNEQRKEAMREARYLEKDEAYLQVLSDHHTKGYNREDSDAIIQAQKALSLHLRPLDEATKKENQIRQAREKYNEIKASLETGRTSKEEQFNLKRQLNYQSKIIMNVTAQLSALHEKTRDNPEYKQKTKNLEDDLKNKVNHAQTTAENRQKDIIINGEKVTIKPEVREIDKWGRSTIIGDLKLLDERNRSDLRTYNELLLQQDDAKEKIGKLEEVIERRSHLETEIKSYQDSKKIYDSWNKEYSEVKEQLDREEENKNTLDNKAESMQSNLNKVLKERSELGGLGGLFKGKEKQELDKKAEQIKKEMNLLAHQQKQASITVKQYENKLNEINKKGETIREHISTVNDFERFKMRAYDDLKEQKTELKNQKEKLTKAQEDAKEIEVKYGVIKSVDMQTINEMRDKGELQKHSQEKRAEMDKKAERERARSKQKEQSKSRGMEL